MSVCPACGDTDYQVAKGLTLLGGQRYRCKACGQRYARNSTPGLSILQRILAAGMLFSCGGFMYVFIGLAGGPDTANPLMARLLPVVIVCVIGLWLLNALVIPLAAWRNHQRADWTDMGYAEQGGGIIWQPLIGAVVGMMLSLWLLRSAAFSQTDAVGAIITVVFFAGVAALIAVAGQTFLPHDKGLSSLRSHWSGYAVIIGGGSLFLFGWMRSLQNSPTDAWAILRDGILALAFSSAILVVSRQLALGSHHLPARTPVEIATDAVTGLLVVALVILISSIA